MAKPHEQAANSHRHGAEHLADYRFKPGQCGNARGRPKGADLKSAILRQLGERNLEGRDLVDAIAAKLLELCAEGDTRALTLILSRLWPIPRREQSDDGETIVICRDYTSNRNGAQPHEAILREEARGQAEADDQSLN